jgi:hypothetical protein
MPKLKYDVKCCSKDCKETATDFIRDESGTVYFCAEHVKITRQAMMSFMGFPLTVEYEKKLCGDCGEEEMIVYGEATLCLSCGRFSNIGFGGKSCEMKG